MRKCVLLTMALVLTASTVAVGGVHIVGGASSGGNTIPFWGTRPGMRWQVFWFQREIGEAGPVTKLEFCNYSGASGAGGTFTSCKFLLCHTKLTAITTSYTGNYSGNTPVTVYSGNYVLAPQAPNAWFTLFNNPTTTLTYNNKDNLLIEVSWVSATGGSNYNKRTSSGGSGRVYAYSATASSGSVSPGYAHYARLTIGYVGVSPTSLGRVKSIFK